jgi:hypothetical protein
MLSVITEYQQSSISQETLWNFQTERDEVTGDGLLSHCASFIRRSLHPKTENPTLASICEPCPTVRHVSRRHSKNLPLVLGLGQESRETKTKRIKYSPISPLPFTSIKTNIHRRFREIA